ncbi:MAG: hypothetical protein LBK61_05990 [Spirochaetaceae bacterium]|jgi:hypothetical protein|nr:hypothetical protein [Spirochaetaceae bacterium]
MNRIKLQELLLNNWPAKILSVGCALVLFVFHRTSSLEERFFSVPLVIEGADSLVPANRYPSMIRVTLRGNANTIYPVINSDIEAYINLDGASEKGTRNFPVLVRKKGTALGDEPLEISVDPMEIPIELDTKLSAFVNITPDVQGEPAAGFELTRATVNPPRIRIEGPEKLVRRYSELPTEAIDIEGRSVDFTVVTRVVNTEPLITPHNESVIAFYGEVRPVMIIRNFAEVPIEIRNLAAWFRFAEPPVFGEIRLKGSQNELEQWQPAGNLFVDCSVINAPGEYDLRLHLQLPANFELLGTVAEASALDTLPTIHVTIVNNAETGE